MSAASCQNDVFQMFKGENSQQVNRRQTPPINQREDVENTSSQQVNRRHTPLPINQREDVFFTSQNNYFEWLRVWKMIVSERNPHNKDLLLLKEHKRKFYAIDKKRA